MKIATILGARPQFIKAAVVSRTIRKHHKEVIVHTGQHYDYNMSEVFFKELDIPKPDYNLGISGGTHGKMTGQMLIAIEEVLIKEKPDTVLVYGDTNSTMAGALAAVKLHVPVIHVEAGNRLGTLNNPEEVNRIVADHVASLRLCCTESAMDFLKKEGISENSYVVGDPMYDAFLYYSNKVKDSIPEELIGLDGSKIEMPAEFYYMTCHREENAGNDGPLTEILSAANSLDAPCIYPVHPRNKQRVKRIMNCNSFQNIIICEPVGYLMSVYLVNHSKKIITDSGGLQREAFFAGRQCVTIFNYVVWPETMVNNRNQLSRPVAKEILDRLERVQQVTDEAPFGDGNSASIILKYIDKYIAKCVEDLK